MKHKKIVIKKMKLKDLKLNPSNPREIDPINEISLEKSLENFGIVETIVYNKKTGNVVGGNQRLRILKRKLSEDEEVYVSVVDLDEVEEKALMVALNNPNLMGHFTSSVSSIIREIEANMPNLFDELNLSEIISDLRGKEDDYIEEALTEFEEKEKKSIEEEKKKQRLYDEMEILPYEHYDYLVIVARDIRDWYFLLDFFNIKRTTHLLDKRKKSYKKIGIGRAIPADKVIKKLKKLMEAEGGKKKPID